MLSNYVTRKSLADCYTWGRGDEGEGVSEGKEGAEWGMRIGGWEGEDRGMGR